MKIEVHELIDGTFLLYVNGKRYDARCMTNMEIAMLIRQAYLNGIEGANFEMDVINMVLIRSERWPKR